MINFRYHIVSLMAVFLALAVGITLGVTLVSGEANKGLAAQAEQDRRQVQLYRDQLSRQQKLDDYRDAYATAVGKQVTAGMLSGTPVAVIAMPNAPRATVRDIQQAVTDAGGTVASTTTINAEVFDTERNADVLDAVAPFSRFYQPDDSTQTKVGSVLGRALLGRNDEVADKTATDIGDALNGKVIKLDRSSEQTARLAIVVTAPTSDPPVGAQTLDRHLQLELAVAERAGGTVLAGPNSTGTEGTDVATARADADARTELSSVDVADLPSGVSTVVMAGREQLNGDQGHYGAANADAPAPELPLR
ncbi:copper transporter [Microlunatus soli]|uniref:Copper transport outer membrane protein, MctB n=1 Tax=Microlunatus soli TaxID=630515 RepID=A0A1H1XYY8_9ACTN|nr:copper transporter [Microlunatus soli]SDT14444.1 Copper transport outer membrane protein, MctB [Microlunatus soli]